MAVPSSATNVHDSHGPDVRRVLIADDHDVVRRGLRGFIESRPGWQVVAEAADGLDALRQAHVEQPDIAIVDYSIPLMNGAQLTRRIRAQAPKTQVLVFTMHESESVIREVLAAGARGFLVKADSEKLLFAALDALAQGKPFFTGQVNEALLAHYLAPSNAAGEPADPLSPREKEIVQLIAEGNTNRAVGELLHISTKTVDAHRASAMAKLGINSTAALVRYAIRNKMIEP